MEFCVLASGSDGNASFVRHGGFGLLIDLGLNPRRLASGLRKFGLSWDDVQAVLLTHPHGDHWNGASALEVHARELPVYCHARNAREMAEPGTAFCALERTGLVRTFEFDQIIAFTEVLRCEAFYVPHDGGTNCGFRFEGVHAESATSVALGYASDLGTWNEGLVRRLHDLDVLALEFNHDETMQRESGRPAFLINRVMGARGHLSNNQAAAFLKRVLACSQPGRLAHLVQLHLSRQCNTPDLALSAAECVLQQMRRRVRVHTTAGTHNPVRIRVETPLVRVAEGFRQSFLPGWEAIG